MKGTGEKEVSVHKRSISICLSNVDLQDPLQK